MNGKSKNRDCNTSEIKDWRAVRYHVASASDKGTWVRLLDPPIEGRIVSGFEGMDVGSQLNVELVGTDVKRGYIDFTKVR